MTGFLCYQQGKTVRWKINRNFRKNRSVVDGTSLYGARELKAASERPSTMREFAVNDNLYDVTENASYWEAVVAALNLIFAVKGTVISIAKVNLSISMSCETLRLIA